MLERMSGSISANDSGPASDKIENDRSELKKPTVFFRTLRLLMIATFVVYAGWNVLWIVQWKVPPSMFQSITHLPCPTTGGTRSMMCLLNGEFSESLKYNAMTIPFTLLLIFTIALALWNQITKGRLVVSSGMLQIWVGTLAIAWLLKLIGDPAYW